MSDRPDPKDYNYVLIHKVLNPKRSQKVPFYDRVYRSVSIEYRGKVYNALFIDKQHHFHRLRKKRKGWVDITEDYQQYLDELKSLEERKEEESEEPVKRKRGRPKKKRD